MTKARLFLLICALLLLAASFLLYSCFSSAFLTVARIREAFAAALRLTPQLQVNQQIILTQTSPIAELAVVQKEELVQIAFLENVQILSWRLPLTQKSLTVQAPYRIKAGYDLRQPFIVKIDSKNSLIEVKMPKPKILSIEKIGELRMTGSSAWFNQLTDEDRQNVLNALDKQAHQSAIDSGLLQDAGRQVKARLQELLRHEGEAKTLEFEDTENPPTSSNL